jgi:guanyl-specific ribonuclease Sa
MSDAPRGSMVRQTTMSSAALGRRVSMLNRSQAPTSTSKSVEEEVQDAFQAIEAAKVQLEAQQIQVIHAQRPDLLRRRSLFS